MSAAAERPLRGPFDGVLQIVRYNWSLYVGAILAAAAVIMLVWLMHPPPAAAVVLIAGAAAGVFWLAASLGVSYYVYDLSDLYRWEWIRSRLADHPHDLVNVHAGLDETSEALRRLYPATELAVLDIYDREEMPEPSIARARAEAGSTGAIRADFRKLPLASGSVDAMCAIFAAHELRRAAAKEAFFGEAWRVLEPGGRLLLVEHLRNGWNLAAFGPGAFHFFPRREWLRVANACGFQLVEEISRTVFVRAFVFGRR
jgi:SAM-dependent methyltransferase